jgi:uncharacterized repeat protein (TIGR01451 family)
MNESRAFGLVRAGGLAVVLAAVSAPLSAQPYSIPWHVVAGGGGTSCDPGPPPACGGTYTLSGTAGQHDAGTLDNLPQYKLDGGFWAWDGSAANLEVIVAGPATAAPLGSDVTYTVTVTNVGPTPATGITLTNNIPTGARYVSNSGGCTYSGGVMLGTELTGGMLSCTLGGLAPSTNTSFTVTVHPYYPGGSLGPDVNANSAAGYPAEVDLVTANNTFKDFAYLLHPYVNVGNAVVAESPGPNSANFGLTLSAQSALPATVAYSTLDGSASAGSDYTPTASTYTFPAMTPMTAVTIQVPVLDDTVNEPGESFSLVLHNSTNASIADAQGIGTITDDDGAQPPQLTLSIDDVTVPEQNSGSSVATFTVTISADPPVGPPVTVNYATADGNATTANGDYVSTASSLSFTNGGGLTQQFTVPVNGDGTDEQNEAFRVVLSGAAGATIAKAQGQGTILDDDGRPALCLPIVTVPFTISNSGSYCLATNLTTNQASGAAITIDADGVLLDLKGFTIDGSAAGNGTQAYGVHASDHSDITVRGGSVRGFLAGVQLDDSTNAAAGLVVRNMRLDENRLAGIWAEGRGTTLLNNLVLQTGGTTALGPDADAYGIMVRGDAARVLNNDVVSVAETNNGQAAAIELREAWGSVVERNRVSNAATSDTTGIRITTGYDVLVIQNRLANLGTAMSYFSGLGKYQGNLTTNVATLVFGAATDALNNQ